MSAVAPAPAPQPVRRRVAPAWASPATVGAVALAGTAILAVGNPNTTHIPLCPLKAITGLDCPFCGSLRAVHSLTRADVVGALDHNVIFTVAAPALVVAWVVWLVRALRQPDAGPLAIPIAAKVAFWVVVAAYGVTRNLPAFHWLASGRGA